MDIFHFPRGRQKIPPKFHFILPKFHFILPKFYFAPTWRIFFFHVGISKYPLGNHFFPTQLCFDMWSVLNYCSDLALYLPRRSSRQNDLQSLGWGARYEWRKLSIYTAREHRYDISYLCSPYDVRSPSRAGACATPPLWQRLYMSLFRLLLEDVLYVVIWYHLLLEGISTSLRRLDHLDNLRV